jgi:hypothetical protein
MDDLARGTVWIGIVWLGIVMRRLRELELRPVGDAETANEKIPNEPTEERSREIA